MVQNAYYSQEIHGGFELFELGDFSLEARPHRNVKNEGVGLVGSHGKRAAVVESRPSGPGPRPPASRREDRSAHHYPHVHRPGSSWHLPDG